MAINNNNGVLEDVLFANQNSDIDTEVLFKPTPVQTETLNFMEPIAPAPTVSAQSGIEDLGAMGTPDVMEEALFASSPIPTSAIESIEPVSPIEALEDISTEPLFDHHSDEGTVLETPREVVEELVLQEEDLAFVEPIKPDFVSEEVLFSEEDNAEINVADAPSVISDELSALAVAPAIQKPKYIEKNFAQKLLEADYEIIKRYDELKNYMLTFKGVKSRVSNDFDSFNMGRTQLIKLGYSTKSLKLFLNLDFASVEPRLKCRDASHKKAYAEVPVFLRIKSPRAMRNAKFLINQVVEKYALKENPKATYVDSVKILREKAKTYDN
ncbi:MAG: hypothetical protein J6V66_00590 [Clostridia bacterium]|nr:hypothetical protein [Clostridia bacterium]